VPENAYGSIEKIEADLWEAADQLRANSKLTSSEYCMPVLGIIFLRHAANRFEAAHREIEADIAAGRMKRKPQPADYVRRRALWLPENARYDFILGQSKDQDPATLLDNAMKAIEESFEPLHNVLPKDFHIFTDRKVLEELLKIFNRDALKTAGGDIFGRIYEYFLQEFSIAKAMDNGEFFTPPSIVQTIVNVIEPDHGTVADIACGSGGMFVQSSHFIEQAGLDTAKRVTFYGHEKTASTIKLAKMNLAVHGLEGQIAEANTFYDDPYTLAGKCDYVMANPPFNVDKVDAKVADDKKRLPFGLPGVNKKTNTVSNGNYLWISFFYSYLNDHGRAGFVMSSQASSAGHDEQTVRRKIVETGAVDAMISIRGNFFYTRAVPCELWFIDKGKPADPASPCQPSPPAPLPAGEGRQHYRGGFEFSGLVDRARELRKTQTPAEDVLWQLLRNRQLAELKFRRQHQVGDYVVDFFCAEQGLVVETDGPVHNTDRLKKHDGRRDAYLRGLGFTVLRFTNDAVIAQIEQVLADIVAAVHPLPLGEGRGEGRSSGALNTRANVLMIDARSIFRKVTRKIYDFSPEQLSNMAAIVWLYRGQSDRFDALVQQYLARAATEAAGIPEKVAAFNQDYEALTSATAPFLKTLPKDSPILTAMKERDEAAKQCRESAADLTADIAKRWAKAPGGPLATLKKASADMEKLSESCRDLVKEIDLLFKLTSRVVDSLGGMASVTSENGAGGTAPSLRELRKLVKTLDESRKAAVEQLKQTAYFHRQAHWLLSRFPAAKLVDVPGLVKLVDRKEIEAADWSLTPGRYVGVAPAEVDEDFDFEQTMRDIHVELADLNKEAATLATTIQGNFEELGI
jgi:type I restriction-modification system DNA methylase subunit